MKRYIAVFIALLLPIMAAQAQNLIPQANEKGKYGYVNEEGTLVIPYTYQEANAFQEGIAKVKKGNKYGFIDEKGNPVGKIKYSYMEGFRGEYCKVAIGGNVNKGSMKGAKWGFIDKKGKEIIPPIYDEIGPFDRGVAYIQKGKAFGFIASDGRILLKPAWTAVGTFNKAGYCWVNGGGKVDKKGNLSGGKYGIVDLRMKWILPASFKSVGVFELAKEDKVNPFLPAGSSLGKTAYAPFDSLAGSSCPYFWFSKSAGATKCGIADLDGKVVVPADRFLQVYAPHDGMAKVIDSRKKKVTIGFYNIDTQKELSLYAFNGKSLKSDQTQLEYCAYSFNHGICKIAHKDICYFIDKTGKKITKDFTRAGDFKEGRCVVEYSGKFGVIDGTGKEVIPYLYEDMGVSFSEGLLRVKQQGKWGFIDKNGETIIPFDYDGAGDFLFGWCFAWKGELVGMIDQRNGIVLPFMWENLKIINQKDQRYIWVKEKDNWYCYDRVEGQLAFEKGYADAGNYNEGVACVKDGEHWGLINVKGNRVIPCLLESYGEAWEAYNYMKEIHKKQLAEVDIRRFVLYTKGNSNSYSIGDVIPDNEWDY